MHFTAHFEPVLRRASQIHTMASHDRQCPDEETPLLQKKAKTPLPWCQINLVFVALIAEPISSAYILAFINQVSQQLFSYHTISDARAMNVNGPSL